MVTYIYRLGQTNEMINLDSCVVNTFDGWAVERPYDQGYWFVKFDFTTGNNNRFAVIESEGIPRRCDRILSLKYEICVRNEFDQSKEKWDSTYSYGGTGVKLFILGTDELDDDRLAKSLAENLSCS